MSKLTEIYQRFQPTLLKLEENRCALICLAIINVVLAIVLIIIIKKLLLSSRLPKWWHGKRVLLTGASTGIGEQVAYILATYDCKFTITGRRKQTLDQVKQKCDQIIKAHGGSGKCISIQADQSKEEDIHRAVDTTLKELGGLDVLLLNAATGCFRPWDTFTSREALDLANEIMNTNFFGMLTYYRDLLPELRRTKGTMLVVGSLVGRYGSPFSPLYAASKAAINAFIEGVTQERGDTVSICVALPGLVSTQVVIDSVGADYMSSAMKPLDCAVKVLETAVLGKQFNMLPSYGTILPYVKLFLPSVMKVMMQFTLPTTQHLMDVHPQWKSEIPIAADTVSQKEE